MQTDLKPLLTLKQAAELLQISPRTVGRLIRDKELPAIKIGHHWRVNASALTKWIQACNEP